MVASCEFKYLEHLLKHCECILLSGERKQLYINLS